MNSKTISRIAIVAAIYVAITVGLSPISYGPVQVRLSEVLTLLPFYFGPWAAVALWLGCMIANAFGGLGMVDIIGGSLLTLIAGLLTARSSTRWTAAVWPVVLNAFGVAGILSYVLGFPYWPTVLTVGLGQFVAVWVVGLPLMGWLARHMSTYVESERLRERIGH